MFENRSPSEPLIPLKRLALYSLLATGLTTLLWECPVLPALTRATDMRLMVHLALLLLPQALAITLPLGLALGVAIALSRRPVSGRVQVMVLALAAACAVVSLVNLGWVIPRSNQSFRTIVSRLVSLSPPPRGDAELTFDELSRRIDEQERRVPAIGEYESFRLLQLRVAYHARWVLASSAIALTLFALVLVRTGMTAWLAGLAVCGTVVGYYVLLTLARLAVTTRSLSAPLALWLPNLALVVLSISGERLFERRVRNARPSDCGSV